MAMAILAQAKSSELHLNNCIYIFIYIHIHPSSEIVYYPANPYFLAEPESLVCKTMTIAISFPSDFLEHGMKFEKRLMKLLLFGDNLQT